MSELKLKRKSKTIAYNTSWFAIASVMLIVLAENQEMIKAYVPEWVYLAVIMFNAGIGVYLRTKTQEPVEPLLKKKL